MSAVEGVALAGKWLNKHKILILLTMINLINYCDRSTLAATLPTIVNGTNTGWGKDVTGTESGLLMTVFVVSLAVCSPIVGYLSDRYNRVLLVVTGVLIWCAATVSCSFAQSYGAFIAFRSIVGVGEGTYTVVAPVLLGDIYEPADRVTVLSIFYFAIPIGTAGGYEIGEAITQSLGWRWAFRVTPIVGATIAIIFGLVAKDPGRGVKDGSDGTSIKSTTSFWADFKYIMQVKTFIGCIAGSVFSTFVTGAMVFLGPTLFTLGAHKTGKSDQDTSDSTFILGVIVGCAGIASSFLAVGLSKLASRYSNRADCLISGVSMLIAVPCGIAFLIFIGTTEMLAYFFGFMVCLGALLPIVLLTSVSLNVLTPSTRSLGQGVLQVISHALGDACSPLLIGILSDTLHNSHGYSKIDALRYSLESVNIALFLGAATFFLAAVSVPKDLAAVEAYVTRQAHGSVDADTTRLLDDDSPQSKGLPHLGSEGYGAQYGSVKL